MRDREFFKEQMKKDRSQIRPCDNKSAKDYPELMSEMYYRQMLLSTDFPLWKASKALRWIEGYANFINNQMNRKRGNCSDKTITKWQIVHVDFFGSFNKEMMYDHPALVYDVLPGGLIVVIPITSKEDVYNKAIATPAPNDLIPLPKGVSVMGNMAKKSTLILKQLKVISKNRILIDEFEYEKADGTKTKEKKKIKHAPSQEDINKKVAHIYGKTYIALTENEMRAEQRRTYLAEKQVAQKDYIIATKDTEIATLKQELLDKDQELYLKNEELEEMKLSLKKYEDNGRKQEEIEDSLLKTP